MKTRKIKKVRLLIVTDYFFPHWTGISKSFFYLVKAIEKDFIITILTVRHSKRLKKRDTLFSAKILREDYLFNISRSKYSVDIIFSFAKMVHEFDTVVINSPCSNILFFALIAKLYRKKIIMYHQGDLILPKGIRNNLIEKLFDFLTLFSFYLADGISTNTDDYGKNSRVIKPFIQKFTPLPLPVYSTSNLQPSQKLKDKISKIKKNKKILFGFGGRFVHEKGFDILFHAIPSILKEVSNAHFLFAGETNVMYENFYDKNKYLLKDIKDHVSIMGLLKEGDLFYFYKQLDFVIISSRSDCFPLFQAEAMLCGVPSIVSDIPGARYLVQKTGFGLPFRKEDVKDLSKKVIEAVRNRKKIMKSKKNVVKILNNKKNVDKIKTIISN